MSDENAKLKALHADAKELMVASAAQVAAREEIVRKRIEALDNVPTEQLYIEYLERKELTENQKVALLLSTLVAKVRLLTSEVVQVRERNRGLMHVILEEAKDDGARRTEIEYLSACLAFKDAMDEQVRWDGNAVHVMEERALLGLGPEKAEQIILHATGHDEMTKQKIAASGSSSVREEFNKALKKIEVERARTERLKVTLVHTGKKLTETQETNTQLKIENARMKELLAMPPSQRSDIMGMAAKTDCSECAKLFRLNQELCDYRRMEDARGADATRQLKHMEKECLDKLADMRKAHVTELQNIAAKKKESDKVLDSNAADLKKRIKELESMVETEKNRTDARLAREKPLNPPPLPLAQQHQHQQQQHQQKVEETLAKRVARQLALSVLHPTWRVMQHDAQHAIQLSAMLQKGEVERALGTTVSGVNQCLADYTVQIVKQCIHANTAFSKQTEKEKNDTARLLYTLVEDSKTVIANVLSKVSHEHTPDVPALRRLIAEAGGNEEQQKIALSLAFDTCARYVESLVGWIEQEKRQTPSAAAAASDQTASFQQEPFIKQEPSIKQSPVKQTVEELLLQQQQQQQQQGEDEESGGDGGFDMDEFMAAVEEGDHQVSRGHAGLRNGVVMKRIAEGRLQNGRKKMHKSAGPAFE